ncbi:MAG TPA: ROK family transcriptional regulator [Verrucomicrobiae bacterium]|nr:ROK family transcriptional regulator [Verrucomicrobiae bacterium]
MKLTLEQMASLESEILKRVRARPGFSRVALARQLQIAPSTVGNYVGRLISEGFLSESPAVPENGEVEAGRPATALRLNPDGGHFVGVDFEARNIMAMSVDFSDTPIKHVHDQIEETDTIAQILRKIETAIASVLPDHQSKLLAIGIGVPGLVDPINGVAIEYKYIHNWRNVQLTEPMAEKFGVPVYLENTIRSMALAEMWFGQGRGERDFLCVGIRSGIGAGIIAGGQLQCGSAHRAGEIGRWRFPWPKTSMTRFFTNNGTANAEVELQEVGSVRAILVALERAREAMMKTMLSAHPLPLKFADVVRAAQQRDALTTQILAVAAETLGQAVSQLVLTLNPSKVILAGPLTLLGDTLLHPLRHRAEELLQASGADLPAIVNSTMGEYSGALGAAALGVHEWKPTR